MSRGFVKEDDQEEAPFIPPRAALPTGVTNYVTSFGKKALLEERTQLESEIREVPTDNDSERRKTLAVLNGKLQLLNERIASSQVLLPQDQPQNEVRFGATVSIKYTNTPTKMNFQIVGVDEADVKLNKLSFVSPIVKAITGKKVGDPAVLELGSEVRQIEIIAITY
ncbi:GreA/GreB family elongation factor [Cochleicola gelatinilyticus]|uniref:Transcription elongation factor GreA n=1 Tax=Cochleicola gelatinilyticus TaxID=1763537 RepID=A0A167HFI7_9FLAO|nr:GreA/GreB family elongation factor [Cochleicola gelatinilyticus]OAB78551.1 transcription elongation factor GreA [Cochleicola gelatinilyticus]